MMLLGMRAGRMRRTSSMGDVAARVAKTVLWAASWAVAMGWLALWVSSPTEKGRAWRKVTVGKPIASSTSKFFGRSATNYLLYTGPVIGLAILALLYLELEKRFPAKRRCVEEKQSPLVRVYWALWTQPLVVKSPLGILSFIDLMGILVVLFTVTWLWVKLIIPNFDTINAAPPLLGHERWQMKLAAASAQLGGVIPFTVTLLFLPVARGSPILRLIDVPFEQAVRYHRWIGNLTILLVTTHGVLFSIYAGSTNQLSLLGEWKHTGISKVAGVVAFLAGIAMWLTSLPYVRARFFNTFYSMHHLYLVFFAFYAFHVDWNHIGEVMGSVFLFFIDRFLRLVQSRRHVTGVSARVLSSGVIELKIPKRPGFNYSPLSFLFLNVPEGISRLEWHPFSTTSSPLNKSGEISLCIKPLGDWTRRLYNAVSEANSSGSVQEPEKSKLSCPFLVHAEGPYGHESNYYLRYMNLVLIAGGIGVTPFLAIIRDLLERYNLQQEELPTNVRLIWCVRQSSELAALHEICPTQIYPEYAYDHDHEPRKLTLEVQAYVTGEKTAGSKITESKPQETVCDTMACQSATSSKNLGVAAIAPNENLGVAAIAPNENLWAMAVIVATIFGFALVSCLFQFYVIAPNDVPNMEKPFSTALETLLFLVSLFVGVVVCGGMVVVFWVRWKEVFWGPEELGDEVRHGHQMVEMEGGRAETLLETCDITEGLRPSFEDIFSTAAERWASSGGETGVLVCGPKSLGESVAAACRSHNFRRRQTQLHFHSVSFTL